MSGIRIQAKQFLAIAMLMVIPVMILGCAPSATTPTTIPQSGATALAPTAASQGGPTPGGALIYANPQKARSDSMDPRTQSGLPGGQVVWLLYNQLVYFDPQEGAKPQLATSWEISPDRKSYTFHLREDVKFHDGTQLDAEAVKFSIDRTVLPEMKGQQAANYLQPIFDSAEVLDPYTVRINIKQPSTAFLYQMSRQVFGIVSPTAVEQQGDEAFELNPVGSGPYKFKEIVSGDHVTLVRNPDYQWGPEVFGNTGPAYPDQVIFRYIPEPTTRLAALEAGEVNFIEDVPLQEVARLQGDPRFRVHGNSTSGLSAALQFNVEKAPTSELAVRQAIEFAIDKEAINKAIFFGFNTPTYSILASPKMVGYDASIGESLYRYDPDHARQLLEDAGWKLGPDGVRLKDDEPLKLVFITDTKQHLEELIQAQLREIGMDVEVRRLDPAGAATAWTEGEHNLTLGTGGFYGRSNPMAEIMSTAYTCDEVGSFNSAHFCDEEFDKLILDAVAIEDTAERAEAYKELQRILLSKAVVAPLYSNTKFWASSVDVDGVINWDPGGIYIRLNGVWTKQ